MTKNGMLLKNILIVLTIFFGFSCADSKLPLFPGILSTAEIPDINDSIWTNVLTWPIIIKKNNKTYKIKYIQNKKENYNIHTFDFSEIDTSKNYSAFYSLITENIDVSPEDYNFGPQFGWRPDGSISFKSMYDENGNSETYSFYENGKTAEIELYDKTLDCEVWIFFTKDGKEIGRSKFKHNFTPLKGHKNTYTWEGIALSEREFFAKIKEFRRNRMGK